uniref:Putative secreted protein n=1 Tax=Anopheles darlingi TaxID=43151 RepID=A0A2M4DQ87_ANODA
MFLRSYMVGLLTLEGVCRVGSSLGQDVGCRVGRCCADAVFCIASATPFPPLPQTKTHTHKPFAVHVDGSRRRLWFGFRCHSNIMPFLTGMAL